MLCAQLAGNGVNAAGFQLVSKAFESGEAIPLEFLAGAFKTHNTHHLASAPRVDLPGAPRVDRSAATLPAPVVLVCPRHWPALPLACRHWQPPSHSTLGLPIKKSKSDKPA